MKPRLGLKPGLMGLGGLALRAFSVLVPPLCVSCEEPTGGLGCLCSVCRAAIAESVRSRTRRIVSADGLALEVKYALAYTPAVARVIADMKYTDKPGLAAFLAPFMGEALGAVSPETVVVPVPMYHAKRRERGYDQSRMLARRLSAAKGLALAAGALTKRRNTPAQATLERGARLVNVAGCFGVKRGVSFAGKHILLVDDVATTGATLLECAKVLLANGAEEVRACVIASSS